MIDLHTHSTASDGNDTPTQLVEQAIEKNIKILAISDHDTIDGLAEAKLSSDGKDILLLNAVELEIKFTRGEFHLLGLNLQKNFDELNKKLSYLKQKRVERNLEIVDRMNKLGIEGSYDDIASLGSGVIGRPHFADYLIKIGKVKSHKVAFDRFLGYGRPLFLPKEGLDLEDAINLIHSTGGYAVMAHPLSLYTSWAKLPEYFKTFKEQGLDGLEVYHSMVKPRESERLLELASQFKFNITGGSDYHGGKRKDRKLGYGYDNFMLNDDLAMWLLNKEQLSFYNKIATF